MRADAFRRAAIIASLAWIGTGCGGPAPLPADAPAAPSGSTDAPTGEPSASTDMDGGGGGGGGGDGGAGQPPQPDGATPGAPVCDPPHSIERGGECVPSCGAAGGDTCAEAGSPLCDGLPLLASYDCASCCDRPALPTSPGPVSFHIIDRRYPVYWDAIAGLLQAHPTVMIASQERPDVVPADRWVKMVHTSYAPSGRAMASLVSSLLADPVAGPRVVMLDELNSNSVAYVREFALEMRTAHPEHQGRWGAYTSVFTGGIEAIDELLLAHAYVAAERYIEQSWYCAQGSSGGARDLALATFFDGNATLARYHWLVERKAAKGSQSHLSVVFGVTDRFLDGASPAVYLDRMFYVWVTRTRHPEAIAIGQGGPGSWKWDQTEPGSIGVGNTSRDLAFAASVDWYSVQGQRTSRLGPVACP